MQDTKADCGRAVPDKMGHIPKELDRLRGEILHLDESTDRMMEVIRPILASPGPVGVSDGGKEIPEGLSPLGYMIEELWRQIYNINTKLQDVCDRVEL